MAMESLEMNGDADPNGEAAVSKGGAGARERARGAGWGGSQITTLIHSPRGESQACEPEGSTAGSISLIRRRVTLIRTASEPGSGTLEQLFQGSIAADEGFISWPPASSGRCLLAAACRASLCT